MLPHQTGDVRADGQAGRRRRTGRVEDVQSVLTRDDAEARKDASPLFHIQESSPPFVVTYCQWDYPTLGAQARQFHTALRKTGINSDLVFVPRESHISEVISMVHDSDPTAQAILKFIK